MTSLRSLSYRNAKYQGEMNNSNYHRQGIGILLDKNFLFVVAIWANNLLNGPALISFPNKIKFFGTMKDNHPNGLCCLALPDSIKIYINYAHENNNPEVAVVFQNAGMILTGMLTKKDKEQSIQLLNKRQFSSEEQRKQIIQSITKSIISDSMRNWRTFLQNQIHTPKKHILEFVELRKNKLIYLGFKRSETLGACFQANGNIANVGHYEKQCNLKQIGRKYIDKSQGEEIQQGIYSASQIFVYQAKQPRPPEVEKVILNYFKQSIAFKNEFVDLSNYQNLCAIGKNINKSNLNLSLQYEAQIQLQQSKLAVYQNKINQSVVEYSLYNIRNEITAAIQRKRSVSRSLNRSWDSGHKKSPEKPSKTKIIDSPKRQMINSRMSNHRKSFYPEQQPFKFLENKEKKLMKTNESFDITRHVNSPNSPTKNRQIPPKAAKSPAKKFKYLDNDLSKLTQIYEEIKYQLEPTNPTKKQQKKNTTSKFDLIQTKTDGYTPEREKKRSISKNAKVYKYC